MSSEDKEQAEYLKRWLDCKNKRDSIVKSLSPFARLTMYLGIISISVTTKPVTDDQGEYYAFIRTTKFNYWNPLFWIFVILLFIILALRDMMKSAKELITDNPFETTVQVLEYVYPEEKDNDNRG